LLFDKFLLTNNNPLNNDDDGDCGECDGGEGDGCEGGGQEAREACLDSLQERREVPVWQGVCVRPSWTEYALGVLLRREVRRPQEPHGRVQIPPR